MKRAQIENQRNIEAIYKEVEKIMREEGRLLRTEWIIPLRGENVSGLYVPWNLQVIPWEENLEKIK